MAEGRILSKRVTRSDKVARLSSDTARLIYTWIIPYLDVEGRMEIDLELFKADIAPKLKHVTEEKILEILNELHTIRLITVYDVENHTYLQLEQFDEHQPNLRKDREKKSKIPKSPPHENATSAILRQNSGEAPAEVRPNIIKDKINIIEAKATPAEVPPVDNSTNVPDPPPIKNAFLKDMEKELSEVMDKIKAKYNFKEQMEIQNWIKSNYRGKHPKALIHTLNAIVKIKHKPDVITIYLDHIIIQENQNYNYEDYQKKAEEFKKPGVVSLEDIFKKMGFNTGIKLMPTTAT
jgi:hypothetical protein